MTAQDALRNLFQRTADHFLDMAAQIAASQLQKGILSLFTNAFTITGGATNTALSTTQQVARDTALYNSLGSVNTFPAGSFANGGRPPVGRASLVGERGPELFVPDSAGTIVPNHAMGGANVVVNVDASGSSVEGDAGQAEQLGSMLAAAVQAEIANQQRPGGLLARR